MKVVVMVEMMAVLSDKYLVVKMVGSSVDVRVDLTVEYLVVKRVLLMVGSKVLKMALKTAVRMVVLRVDLMVGTMVAKLVE